MKKVMNVGIGGFGFMIDEDAYYRLNNYLDRFKGGLNSGREASEVMADIEQRIAELFHEGLRYKEEVVSLALVERVIVQLGFPEGADRSAGGAGFDQGRDAYTNTKKRLYRDPDNKMFGGVCGGLSAYFDVDLVLFRVLFIVAFLCGSLGFWAYIILWIAVPLARTVAEKLEMRGLPVTAENIRKMGQQNR